MVVPLSPGLILGVTERALHRDKAVPNKRPTPTAHANNGASPGKPPIHELGGCEILTLFVSLLRMIRVVEAG